MRYYLQFVVMHPISTHFKAHLGTLFSQLGTLFPISSATEVPLVVRKSTRKPRNWKDYNERLVKDCVNYGIEVEQALADRIFDCKDIHNYLAYEVIQPGIPPRKNSSRRSRGSPSRVEQVRFFQDFGEKPWKETRKYAKRVAAGRTFSAFKQLFGERVMAKKWENIVHELKSKF